VQCTGLFLLLFLCQSSEVFLLTSDLHQKIKKEEIKKEKAPSSKYGRRLELLFRNKVF